MLLHLFSTKNNVVIRLSNEGIGELFSALVFLSQCREENKAPRAVSDLLLARSREGEPSKPFPATASPSTHRLEGCGTPWRAQPWGTLSKRERPAGCQTLQPLGALRDASFGAAFGPGTPALHPELWAALGKGRNSCSKLHFQPFVPILGHNINHTESFPGERQATAFSNKSLCASPTAAQSEGLGSRDLAACLGLAPLRFPRWQVVLCAGGLPGGFPRLAGAGALGREGVGGQAHPLALLPWSLFLQNTGCLDKYFAVLSRAPRETAQRPVNLSVILKKMKRAVARAASLPTAVMGGDGWRGGLPPVCAVLPPFPPAVPGPAPSPG